MSEKNGPLHVGDGDFEQTVLQSEHLALVDFWAPWCGPCRMVAPALEELAQEYAGRAVVAKVNTDEHQEWARHFGIRGIPTLLFVKAGQEVDRIVGAVPKKVIQSKIDALL
jgi:thioredoxin 1